MRLRSACDALDCVNYHYKLLVEKIFSVLLFHLLETNSIGNIVEVFRFGNTWKALVLHTPGKPPIGLHAIIATKEAKGLSRNGAV